MHDNLGKAELLNEYFCSVFVHDNGIINDEWWTNPRSTSMNKVFLYKYKNLSKNFKRPDRPISLTWMHVNY